MDPYQFEDATRTSSNYPRWTPWRTIKLIFLVITFPIWIIPYLIVRWFRHSRKPLGGDVANGRVEEVTINRRVSLWVFVFLFGGLSLYFMVEKFVYQREHQPTIGYYWFLPSVLILVWLGMHLGSFPGIVTALSVGGLLMYFFGGLMLPGTYGNYLVITPAAPTMFGGLVGSIVGSQINPKKPIWEIGLALVGLILGFGIGFLLYAGSVG